MVSSIYQNKPELKAKEELDLVKKMNFTEKCNSPEAVISYAHITIIKRIEHPEFGTGEGQQGT